MKMNINVTFSGVLANLLKREYEFLEVRPSTLLRMFACKILKPYDGTVESQIVRLGNRAELVAYAHAKALDIDLFFTKATAYYMKKYPLTELQKAEIEVNIEN